MWHVMNMDTGDEYLTPSWSLAKKYIKSCLDDGYAVVAHRHP